jgi:hypothetical protein
MFCDRFGIDAPIVLVPMGPDSNEKARHMGGTPFRDEKHSSFFAGTSVPGLWCSGFSAIWFLPASEGHPRTRSRNTISPLIILKPLGVGS